MPGFAVVHPDELTLSPTVLWNSGLGLAGAVL